MEKKTAGIVCDNYKIEKFKEELIAKGFTDFEVIGNPAGKISTIKVTCYYFDLPDIAKICQGVEEYFAALKN